jgi:hypothetical protein
MNELTIDATRMVAALARSGYEEGMPACKGYLNRASGSILFVPDCDDKDDIDIALVELFDPDNSADMVRNLACIRSAPSEWIEIPRYDGCGHDNGAREVFVELFLLQNGIEVAAWGDGSIRCLSRN